MSTDYHEKARWDMLAILLILNLLLTGFLVGSQVYREYQAQRLMREYEQNLHKLQKGK